MRHVQTNWGGLANLAPPGFANRPHWPIGCFPV